MDIRSIALDGPLGLEAQTDYRGDAAPGGILIALADGRIITIGHLDGYPPDMIVVHGPDMETLLRIPVPDPIRWPVVEAAEAEARADWSSVPRKSLDPSDDYTDSPAGAGDQVEADRG